MPNVNPRTSVGVRERSAGPPTRPPQSVDVRPRTSPLLAGCWRLASRALAPPGDHLGSPNEHGTTHRTGPAHRTRVRDRVCASWCAFACKSASSVAGVAAARWPISASSQPLSLIGPLPTARTATSDLSRRDGVDRRLERHLLTPWPGAEDSCSNCWRAGARCRSARVMRLNVRCRNGRGVQARRRWLARRHPRTAARRSRRCWRVRPGRHRGSHRAA